VVSPVDLCYKYTSYRNNSQFEIETEIFMKAKKLGLNIKEVPSVEAPRLNGKTNLSAWKDGYKILKTIFREGLNKNSHSRV